MYILFFLCWIIFNGQLTVEIGIIGIFVAALLYAFICKFMGWSFRKDIHMMQYAIFMVGYLFVLIWEIIKANFDTMKMLFTSTVLDILTTESNISLMLSILYSSGNA